MPSKAGICIIEQAVAESVLCGEAPYDVAHAIRTWPERPGYEEESIYKHVHNRKISNLKLETSSTDARVFDALCPSPPMRTHLCINIFEAAH